MRHGAASRVGPSDRGARGAGAPSWCPSATRRADCHPDERIGEVRERARAANWNTCFVLAPSGVVLGRPLEKELSGPGDLSAADVMRSGPTTFRPNVTVHQMLDYMREHELTTMPVTTSEGRLLGLALIEDLEAAHSGGPSADASSRRIGSER